MNPNIAVTVQRKDVDMAENEEFGALASKFTYKVFLEFNKEFAVISSRQLFRRHAWGSFICSKCVRIKIIGVATNSDAIHRRDISGN